MQSAATTPTPKMLATGSVNFQAKFIHVNGINTSYHFFSTTSPISTTAKSRKRGTAL